jgi:hypothetical protein
MAAVIVEACKQCGALVWVAPQRLASGGIEIGCEAKVNHVERIALPAGPRQEVIWLDIAV